MIPKLPHGTVDSSMTPSITSLPQLHSKAFDPPFSVLTSTPFGLEHRNVCLNTVLFPHCLLQLGDMENWVYLRCFWQIHPQNISTKINNSSTKYPHNHSPFATSDSRTIDPSNYLFVSGENPFPPFLL